jgi:hypothetical protein
MVALLLLTVFGVAAIPPATSSPSDAGPTTSQTILDEAVSRLERGEAREAVGLLLSHVRRGDLADADTRRAADVFFAAAAALDSGDREDNKAAAVAADAAATLAPTPEHRVRAAALLARYADSVADDDGGSALGLARRALDFDGENAEARALEKELAGTDTWVTGHLTLLGAVGLLATSATAFVLGLEQERQLRSTPHRRAEVDVFLQRRAAAAIVAWPTLIAGVSGVGIGTAMVVTHDPGPDAVLPQPFPPFSLPPPAAPVTP